MFFICWILFVSWTFFIVLSIYSSSSHQRYSIKIGVLKNFVKFTGKHLCQSLFFNKLADLRPITLLKKRIWHRCFPVDFTKFLRTPIFIFYRTALVAAAGIFGWNYKKRSTYKKYSTHEKHSMSQKFSTYRKHSTMELWYVLYFHDSEMWTLHE